MTANPSKRRGVLDLIERIGNRLPDQLTLFAIFAAVVFVASWLLWKIGLTVTHPTTGASVSVFNLASRDGVQWIFTSVVSNFVGFAPLGTVLVSMIGIGLAERTGLFSALIKSAIAATPLRVLTPAMVFIGIMSHTAADAGYVLLPPIAAAIYASVGRHPLAGVAAVMAGVGGGFSANLLICALDPLLAGLTQDAARILDKSYSVHAAANYYFMAASTFVLTLVGWAVTAWVVEPRLGRWSPAAGSTAPVEAKLEPITREEKRGLLFSGVAVALVALLVVWLVAPQDGILRSTNPELPSGDVRRFDPFFKSLVPIIMLVFFIPGIVFGLTTRRVRSDKDVARMTSDVMATMGGYVMMAFVAAQFIRWFDKSNLGLILAIEGGATLKSIGLGGAGLMIGFVVLTATINLLISSASAKWTILAPVFVPMFMLVGISPEATQCFYRVGDSVTNIVTPLNVYFPIILAVVRRYTPEAGLGTIISLLLPYSVAYLVIWTIMACVWIGAGWAIGPASPLEYVAPTP